MLIVYIDISDVYGVYVFSEFSNENFYHYIRELENDFREEFREEGTWIQSIYPCITKVKEVKGGDSIIFCEEKWEEIPGLIKMIGDNY